jgi:hypothetical protein
MAAGSGHFNGIRELGPRWLTWRQYARLMVLELQWSREAKSPVKPRSGYETCTSNGFNGTGAESPVT